MRLEVICCLLFVVFCISDICSGRELSAAELKKELAGIEEMINKGKVGKAAGKLKKLAGKRGLSDLQRTKIACLLARSYRKRGKLKDAKKILSDVNAGKTAEYHMELGEFYFTSGKFPKALKEASLCSGAENLHTLYGGEWVVARTHFGGKCYLLCMNSCKRIFEGIGKLTENYGKDEHLKMLEQKARDLYAKAKKLYEESTFGMDYIWYKRGREAQFAGQFRKAIECYGKIRKGTLKEAGICYSGHCLAALGEDHKAIKKYKELSENEKAGLYDGEALYQAAMLTYSGGKGGGTVKRATKFLQQFQEWIKKKPSRIKMEGVKPAAIQKAREQTPYSFTVRDEYGRLRHANISPEAVINPASCRWYQRLLVTRMQLFYGYLKNCEGDKQKASEAFTHAAKLANSNQILRSDAVPLLFEGLITGFFLLPGECAKKISSKVREQVNYVCFLLITGDMDGADRILASVEKTVRQGSYEDSACILTRGYRALFRRDKGKALKSFKELYENRRFRRYATGSCGSYLYACMISAGDYSKAKEIFSELSSGKSNFSASRALLAMAVAGVNHGKRESSLTACREILSKHADSPYADAAGTLKKALERTEAGKSLAMVKTADGKILRHKTTLIMPNGSDWDRSTKGLRSGDLVMYQVRCMSRNPCKIIRSFTVSLDSGEPKPPKSRGNTLVFLRAPVLYIKNLQYDLSGIGNRQ